MRKIREVLRLKFEVGLSARQIAVSVQIGRVTVGDYLNRFAACGLSWPCSLSDAELERQLLSLNASKTRLIEFGRFAARNRRKRGLGKPETFDFLGFTHCCSTNRSGGFNTATDGQDANACDAAGYPG